MKKYIIATSIAALALVSVAYAQSYSFSNNLSVGSSGQDVTALQNWLIGNGFDIPALSSGLSARGYFGQQTLNALVRFQASVGLPSTGYFGPLTRGRLNGGNGCNSCNVPSAINVVSPNGGEVWLRTSTQNITWNASSGLSGQTGNVYLEYPLPACADPAINPVIRCMIAVRAPQLIAHNIYLGQGSYNWNVGQVSNTVQSDLPLPNSIADDGQYKIKICNADSSVCDDSNGTFTISSSGNTGNTPVINGVDAPTSLSVGQTGTWTIRATDPANSQLSYYVDWGDTNNVCPTGYSCAPNTLNSAGSVAYMQTSTFTHSYANAGTYTVHITVRNSAGLVTQTSSSVNVGTTNNAGPLSIVSPNGGEVWTKGTTQTIRWTSPYYFAAAYADLKITQKLICTTQVCPMIAYAPYTIATNIPINQNSYNWNVGVVNSFTDTYVNNPSETSTIPDGQYTIQICQTGTSVCDTSNNTFTVTSNGSNTGTITVTSPRGGEVWTANTNQAITSTVQNAMANQKVDMYLDAVCTYAANSGACQTYVLDRNIQANVPYYWITATDINNAVIPAGQYRVRVCLAGSLAICGASPSYFTITSGISYYPNLSQCPVGYVCTPSH